MLSFGAVIGEATLARRLATLTEYSTDQNCTMAGLVEAEPPPEPSA